MDNAFCHANQILAAYLHANCVGVRLGIQFSQFIWRNTRRSHQPVEALAEAHSHVNATPIYAVTFWIVETRRSPAVPVRDLRPSFLPVQHDSHSIIATGRATGILEIFEDIIALFTVSPPRT